ncbi:unnamed protein product, partial [Cyprideis torosa]
MGHHFYRLVLVVEISLFLLRAEGAPSQRAGCGAYNPSSYICCNGVLTLGSETKLAMGLHHWILLAVAISLSLLQAQGADYSRGCGAYNANIYTCCNGVLNLGSRQSCCGTKAYNSGIYTCCNGVLNLGSRQSCCGTKAYNSGIYTCCNGVLNLGSRQSCCGTKAYNSGIYTCCNGTLYLGSNLSCGK